MTKTNKLGRVSDRLKRLVRLFVWFRIEKGDHCTTIDVYRWNRVIGRVFMRETFIGKLKRKLWIIKYCRSQY